LTKRASFLRNGARIDKYFLERTSQIQRRRCSLLKSIDDPSMTVPCRGRGLFGT
jgi:hypothetical protein